MSYYLLLAFFFARWLLVSTEAWLSTSSVPYRQTRCALNEHARWRSNHEVITRRTTLSSIAAATFAVVASVPMKGASAAILTIDVNNAMAREFTAFPGLYPTIATKIVKGAQEKPFQSKKEIYALLNDVEQERLKQYDNAIIVNKPDKALQQFKTSQICKYECGGRTSSSFRDEQIKAIQADRR